MNEVNIERISNGFILTTMPLVTKSAHLTIEDAFRWALLHLEGKCDTFGGNAYAKITIEYERPEDADKEKEATK